MNSEKPSAAQLAVLIGAPHNGQAAMHNDVVAMYEALRCRQMPPEAIISLEGKLTRNLVLNFLTSIHDVIVERGVQEFFLYWTGHGLLTGETAQTARLGAALQAAGQSVPEHHIFWDEVFGTLAIPSNVKVTLLPDH